MTISVDQATALHYRKPQRVTITIPYGTHAELIRRSDSEGRSLSNLAAFLLEQSLQNP